MIDQKKKAKKNKATLVGATMLALGILSLIGLVFAQDGFGIFYIFYSSIPLIVIGLAVLLIATTKENLPKK